MSTSLLLYANNADLKYADEFIYMDMVHFSGLYMGWSLALLHSIAGHAGFECIPNTIIYTFNKFVSHMNTSDFIIKHTAALTRGE